MRECYRCKDKYVGYIGNWGVEVQACEDGEVEAICLYCYFGQEERKWTPEWV
jgi:hypothetical protein